MLFCLQDLYELHSLCQQHNSVFIIALQEMLNICFHKGKELDNIFNNSKSFLFKIGSSYDCCIQNLKLGAADIICTCEIKYLGVNFCSGTNLWVDLHKYYTTVNSIISHNKNINDILKLNLLETYTLPILKYACKSLLLNPNTLYTLNVCWNNVFRKVFKMNRWKSVKIVSSIFIISKNWSSLQNYKIVIILLCWRVTTCFHIPVN